MQSLIPGSVVCSYETVKSQVRFLLIATKTNQKTTKTNLPMNTTDPR